MADDVDGDQQRVAVHTPNTVGNPPADESARASHFTQRRKQVTGIVLYLLIAFALCWAACLPLWMGPGLSDPTLVAICGGIAMFTPAIAAILVVRLVERRSWRRAPSTPRETHELSSSQDSILASLGLHRRGGIRRLIPAILVGMLAPVVLLLASQLLAGLFGTFELDLALRQVARDLDLPAGTTVTQIWSAFGLRLLMAMLLGATINVVLALGEEIGWRGFLMPRIHRLWGLPAAIIAGGIIWGLWHAPLILLGYNYPDAAPWVGQLSMIAACTFFGGFIYLLTLWFGTLWPAAIAHGVNNATSAMIMTSLLLPGATIDTVNGSALGWPGWVVYGAVVIVGSAFILRARSRRGARSEKDASSRNA